jgi:hypothetical protein
MDPFAGFMRNSGATPALAKPGVKLCRSAWKVLREIMRSPPQAERSRNKWPGMREGIAP